MDFTGGQTEPQDLRTAVGVEAAAQRLGAGFQWQAVGDRTRATKGHWVGVLSLMQHLSIGSRTFSQCVCM
jgi:hypothetical protein